MQLIDFVERRHDSGRADGNEKGQKRLASQEQGKEWIDEYKMLLDGNRHLKFFLQAVLLCDTGNDGCIGNEHVTKDKVRVGDYHSLICVVLDLILCVCVKQETDLLIEKVRHFLQNESILRSLWFLLETCINLQSLSVDACRPV
jgi:hypothetical protein